jgi:hypothetical protein
MQAGDFDQVSFSYPSCSWWVWNIHSQNVIQDGNQTLASYGLFMIHLHIFPRLCQEQPECIPKLPLQYFPPARNNTIPFYISRYFLSFFFSALVMGFIFCVHMLFKKKHTNIKRFILLTCSRIHLYHAEKRWFWLWYTIFGFSFGLYFSYHTCLCRVWIAIQTKKSRAQWNQKIEKENAMQMGVTPDCQYNTP